MSETLCTIQHLLQEGRRQLTAAGLDEAPLEAALLLGDVLHRQNYELHLHPERQCSAEEVTAYRALLARRAAHEPYAYINGHREFYSLDFLVAPGVLIPRPETELLIELAVKLAEKQTFRLAVDVGTGSGAIACALAHELPGIKVLALDISDRALEIAAQNISRLKLENSVSCQKSDLLATAPQNIDLILSNPPYVPSGEIPTLMAEVQKEPLLALDGGADGLDPYRRLAPQAFAKLQPGGWLLVEHGGEQAAAISDIFRKNGFINITTHNDLAGLNRVTMAQKAKI